MIEHQIDSGAGSVDVALLRKDMRIACEISISTTAEHELGNVEKCLDAGFHKVLMVAENAAALNRLKKHITPHLKGQKSEKVHFLLPEPAVNFVQDLAPPASHERTVRGYKVKVRNRLTDPEDAAARRRTIGEIMAKSTRKIRDPK